MIGQIAALALNTFREAVRDRVLYSIFFFAPGCGSPVRKGLCLQ